MAQQMRLSSVVVEVDFYTAPYPCGPNSSPIMKPKLICVFAITMYNGREFHVLGADVRRCHKQWSAASIIPFVKDALSVHGARHSVVHFGIAETGTVKEADALLTCVQEEASRGEKFLAYSLGTIRSQTEEDHEYIIDLAKHMVADGEITLGYSFKNVTRQFSVSKALEKITDYVCTVRVPLVDYKFVDDALMMDPQLFARSLIRSALDHDRVYAKVDMSAAVFAWEALQGSKAPLASLPEAVLKIIGHNVCRIPFDKP